MKTKINHLLGTVLSLLVTFGIIQRVAAERIVFYAPAIATNSSRGGQIVSYTTNHQIFTMNVDGTEVRQLTTGTTNATFPSWRPDQTHILFHRAGAVHVMDANGAGTFTVAAARGTVGSDWSPDGSMICYVGDALAPPGPWGLWMVSVNPSAKGNKPKVGTPIHVSDGDFYGLAWSPDGTRIAFSDQSTGLQPPGPRIRVLDLATGTKTTLDLAHSLLPSWDSTGNRLAFVSGAGTTNFWQLYVMNANFSGLTQLTDYDIPVLWPSWSYDDTQIAFRLGSGRAGPPPDGAALYKLTLATGELTLLRNKGDHPDWRP